MRIRVPQSKKKIHNMYNKIMRDNYSMRKHTTASKSHLIALPLENPFRIHKRVL